MHGTSFPEKSYFLAIISFFGSTMTIAVLLAWELHSGELNPQFYVFLFFLEMLETCFRMLFVFTFFRYFDVFLEAFWVSFGAFLEPLSFPWRAGVMLLRVFGLPGLSVSSLCSFLWCLGPVWAVCGLSLLLLGQFGCNICLFVPCFSIACRI